MKKIIEFYVFVVFSTLLGGILVTSFALNMLEEQQRQLHRMPSDESDLVEKAMRGWLESEGLASELTEDIATKFRGSADLLATHVNYSITITQHIEELLKIARVFLVVGSIILIFGFIVYPKLQKRYKENN